MPRSATPTRWDVYLKSLQRFFVVAVPGAFVVFGFLKNYAIYQLFVPRELHNFSNNLENFEVRRVI